MNKKAVTISDIARIAGVSKKSVSRVINNESGISELTRERIQSIIKTEGYHPDRRARALASNRSYLIALAYNNPNPAYVLELMQGVLREANKRGYEVILHPVTGSNASVGDQLVEFMQRSGCDGLILTPPLSEMPELLGQFTQERWRVTRIAGDDLALTMPQIRYDDRSAALAITSYLIKLGHTRIGFVGGPEHSGPTQRRLAGFRDALTAQGHSFRQEWEAWGNFTFLSGLEAGRKILSAEDRPTAIMCCNDEMAAGLIHAARAFDLTVPDDLSVTGFDDSPIAQEVWPTLTTVRQPVVEMAAASATTLIEWIGGSSLETHPAMFAHIVVTRDSAARLEV